GSPVLAGDDFYFGGGLKPCLQRFSVQIC
ncbi:hypothetical protein CCACVL1_28193, partial [Corchorus capsularis]